MPKWRHNHSVAVQAHAWELGSAPAPAVLDQFVLNELDQARDFENREPTKNPASVRALANEFFLAQLGHTS